MFKNCFRVIQLESDANPFIIHDNNMEKLPKINKTINYLEITSSSLNSLSAINNEHNIIKLTIDGTNYCQNNSLKQLDGIEQLNGTLQQLTLKHLISITNISPLLMLKQLRQLTLDNICFTELPNMLTLKSTIHLDYLYLNCVPSAASIVQLFQPIKHLELNDTATMEQILIFRDQNTVKEIQVKHLQLNSLLILQQQLQIVQHFERVLKITLVGDDNVYTFLNNIQILYSYQCKINNFAFSGTVLPLQQFMDLKHYQLQIKVIKLKNYKNLQSCESLEGFSTEKLILNNLPNLKSLSSLNQIKNLKVLKLKNLQLTNLKGINCDNAQRKSQLQRLILKSNLKLGDISQIKSLNLLKQQNNIESNKFFYNVDLKKRIFTAKGMTAECLNYLIKQLLSFEKIKKRNIVKNVIFDNIQDLQNFKCVCQCKMFQEQVNKLQLRNLEDLNTIENVNNIFKKVQTIEIYNTSVEKITYISQDIKFEVISNYKLQNIENYQTLLQFQLSVPKFLNNKCHFSVKQDTFHIVSANIKGVSNIVQLCQSEIQKCQDIIIQLCQFENFNFIRNQFENIKRIQLVECMFTNLEKISSFPQLQLLTIQQCKFQNLIGMQKQFNYNNQTKLILKNNEEMDCLIGIDAITNLIKNVVLINNKCYYQLLSQENILVNEQDKQFGDLQFINNNTEKGVKQELTSQINNLYNSVLDTTLDQQINNIQYTAKNNEKTQMDYRKQMVKISQASTRENLIYDFNRKQQQQQLVEIGQQNSLAPNSMLSDLLNISIIQSQEYNILQKPLNQSIISYISLNQVNKYIKLIISSFSAQGIQHFTDLVLHQYSYDNNFVQEYTLNDCMINNFKDAFQNNSYQNIKILCFSGCNQLQNLQSDSINFPNVQQIIISKCNKLQNLYGAQQLFENSAKVFKDLNQKSNANNSIEQNESIASITANSSIMSNLIIDRSQCKDNKQKIKTQKSLYLRILDNQSLHNLIGVDDTKYLTKYIDIDRKSKIQFKYINKRLLLQNFSQEGVDHISAVLGNLIMELDLTNSINLLQVPEFSKITSLTIDTLKYQINSDDVIANSYQMPQLTLQLNNQLLQNLCLKNQQISSQMELSIYKNIECLFIQNCQFLNENDFMDNISKIKYLKHLCIINTPLSTQNIQYLNGYSKSLQTMILVQCGFDCSDLNGFLQEIKQLELLKMLIILNNPINRKINKQFVVQLLTKHPNQNLTIQVYQKVTDLQQTRQLNFFKKISKQNSNLNNVIYNNKIKSAGQKVINNVVYESNATNEISQWDIQDLCTFIQQNQL